MYQEHLVEKNILLIYTVALTEIEKFIVIENKEGLTHNAINIKNKMCFLALVGVEADH